jgi:serine/threonine-protein kinase HipA
LGQAAEWQARVPNEAGYRRLPFISGLTILGAQESESSLQSYRGLEEQMRRFGSEPAMHGKELWRRMVFNILCNNNDDHLRNHGFLWDGRGWRLSPGYDIVSFPQVARNAASPSESDDIDGGRLCIML